MSKLRARDKWFFLTVGSRWDRSTVPIYEASAGGRCVPLLKTLLTSICTNDCRYCIFRVGRRCPREMWQPEELAGVTFKLWVEGRITGLFLSSSLFKDPDYTTERQLEVLKRLRDMGYTGYIHLKLMPGVSRHYIREAVELADRVGINMEAPNRDIFSEICPSKGGFEEAITKRLEWIVDEVRRAERLRRDSPVKFGFGRAGIDTQMIVGAVEDDDMEYLKASWWLYKRLGLRRVYYSGFEPIPETPLETRPPCPPYREYRLYQCSFLIRDYGFKLEELTQLLNDEGLLPNIDPKLLYAKRHPELFPIDLNDASYREMVKVPGIGPLTARRIINARRVSRIRYLSDLERIVGASLARAIAPYIDLKDKKLTYFSKNALV
ncbi:radical SAM protein [Candidatus Bathyarchaeota archaeon]|nr:MAG: radical SAM protein [Candidatus Bathyarchaeota archaeon]